MEGGTISACNFGSWDCKVVAEGIFMPIATTMGKNGVLYAAIHALLPDAMVVALTDKK